MQQHLIAAAGAHPRHQVRPSVFDALIPGLQKLNDLGVDAEAMARQIGREPLEGYRGR